MIYRGCLGPILWRYDGVRTELKYWRLNYYEKRRQLDKGKSYNGEISLWLRVSQYFIPQFFLLQTKWQHSIIMPMSRLQPCEQFEQILVRFTYIIYLTCLCRHIFIQVEIAPTDSSVVRNSHERGRKRRSSLTTRISFGRKLPKL